MSTPQECVVAVAKSQVGYYSTYGKFNRHSEALDQTDLYNGAKNDQDWCDIFYDWCLVQEFGVEITKEMTGQPSCGCGAGCAFSASYYRALNQWSWEPSLGAQIFFGERGDEYHTGMVVGYDSAHVYTVEGNTGYSSGYSGGAVLDCSYSRSDSHITGYGVPRWSMVDGTEPVVDVSHVWEDTGELDVDATLACKPIAAWQRALAPMLTGLSAASPRTAGATRRTWYRLSAAMTLAVPRSSPLSRQELAQTWTSTWVRRRCGAFRRGSTTVDSSAARSTACSGR